MHAETPQPTQLTCSLEQTEYSQQHLGGGGWLVGEAKAIYGTECPCHLSSRHSSDRLFPVVRGFLIEGPVFCLCINKGHAGAPELI